jgi:hypothetical protein
MTFNYDRDGNYLGVPPRYFDRMGNEIIASNYRFNPNFEPMRPQLSSPFIREDYATRMIKHELIFKEQMEQNKIFLNNMKAVREERAQKEFESVKKLFPDFGKSF